MENYIQTLIIAGYTNKTIKARCKKNNYGDIDDLTIDKLRNDVKLSQEIERKNKSIESSNKKIKGQAILPLFTEAETYFDFAKRVGVETEYTDIGQLIGTVQKLTADIFIKQALCLLRGLEILSEGKNIDLEILYRGYDISFKAIDKAWGMQTLIDLNAAIQTLNAKGFEINVDSTVIPEIPEISEQR